MPAILSAGLLIGVVCGLWTFVMGFTGWYKDPGMMKLFLPVVIALEIAGLVWGLRKTAAEGRSYRSQIVAGAEMSVIAGVVIMACSLLFTMVLFPTYFTDLQDTYRQVLTGQGKSDAEVAEAVSRSVAGATPMGQALQGFVGTLITGIVSSAVIAIWARAGRESSSASV